MLTTPEGRRGALDRTGIIALVAGVLLLVGIGAASAWQSWSDSQVLSGALAARQQRNVLLDVLIATQEAETGQRGYLLTHNETYLRPLDAAERSLPGLLGTLHGFWTTDPRIGTLQRLVDAKLAELRQTVTLAQAGQGDVAMQIVQSNVGNNDMERVRQIMAALQAELDGTIARHVSQVVRGGRRLVAIDIAGLVMIMALAGLIGLGLQRYLHELRAAQARAAEAYDALESSNERLDEQVRERTAELTAANEEIQRFAYIVSHDLRAPLVNIMGFTSELEQATGTLARYATAPGAPAELRELAEEEVPEALRFIKSSTVKMDGLINAILRLSREGRRVLSPERLEVAGLLRTLAETMQHQADVKQATVTVGTVPDLMGDRLAFEQVFSNVIENALKYLKPGRPGQVTVTGRVEEGRAVYEVADNGRGIAERDLGRVFELFRRAGDQSVPGEGIGLAHVRALVRRMGGRIDCRSALDVGTTFTITLPLDGQRPDGLRRTELTA